MENVLSLEIISPLQIQTFDIEWIEIHAPQGSFIIGPGHQQLVSLLMKKALLTYKKQEQDEATLIAQGGMVIVSNNKVILLLE